MSETTKWTKGPWESVYTESRKILDGTGHALFCDTTYYPWCSDNDADWHLISAAPDLYEALERCVQVFLEIANAGHYPAPLYDNGGWMFAINALKKARGESNAQ